MDQCVEKCILKGLSMFRYSCKKKLHIYNGSCQKRLSLWTNYGKLKKNVNNIRNVIT